MTGLKIGALGAALAAGLALSASAQESHNFAVVGTWGGLTPWQDHEGPFWNQTLPEASGGLGLLVTERSELEGALRQALLSVEQEQRQALVNVICQ